MSSKASTSSIKVNESPSQVKGRGVNAYINSQYVEASNALRGKKARRRIVVYVESYDDVYFWRTVLSRFENERLYFEVMLPSKNTLTRGKKSVLMNFLKNEENQRQNGAETTEGLEASGVDSTGTRRTDNTAPAPAPTGTRRTDTVSPASRVGQSMIACVDADYDYLLQGATEQSRLVLESPYVFHTYVYAIENYQCYAPSLHDVCVAVTLNDHRIFDFREYYRLYSEACFPLFVWSVWAYRTGNHNKFTLSDFNRVCDIGGFSVDDPMRSITNIRRKVETKVRDLQRQYPDNKEAYLKVKADLLALGVTAQTTYLYMQGHHLFDTVTAPILTKVCDRLRQEREEEISASRAHPTQKQNELSCYENSIQDIKAMLKKNVGCQQSPRFLQVQEDVRRRLGL